MKPWGVGQLNQSYLNWIRCLLWRLLIFVVVLSGCKRPILPFESRRLVEISISCELSQFPQHVFIPCQATALYSDGSEKSVTGIVTWEVDNSGILEISNAHAGWVRGLSSGSTNLKASMGGIEQAIGLTVTAASVVGCAVTPANNAYRVGMSVQYSNVCVFSDSSYIDVTNSSTWSSSSPATALVSTDMASRGKVIAANEGASTILATFDGVQGQTGITVLPKELLMIQIGPKVATVVEGFGVPFTVTGVYSDLSTVNLTPIAMWSVTDGAIASISNGAGTTGYLSAIQSGSSFVVVNFGTFYDTALVTVTNPVLNAITITSTGTSIIKGLSRSFVANGHYSDGSISDITDFVSWGSADNTIATVGNSAGSRGVVTSLSVGSTNIEASLGAVSAQTTVTITPAELISIAITPLNPTFSVSDSLQLNAIGTYTDLSTSDITGSVTWITSNGSVASISNSPGNQGSGVAIGVGTVVISASLGTIVGQTNVIVTPATLTSITISPANSTISGIGSKQLTAIGHYSDGSSVNLTSAVVWTSSDPSIFTVANNPGNSGVATGVSLGSATAFASFGVIVGQTTLTVIPSTLISIVVTPSNSTIKLLSTKQYVATGVYADGSTVNLTSSVVWTSSNIIAAVIAPTGLATGLVLGSTTITATLGSISGATILTCTLL